MFSLPLLPCYSHGHCLAEARVAGTRGQPRWRSVGRSPGARERGALGSVTKLTRMLTGPCWPAPERQPSHERAPSVAAARSGGSVRRVVHPLVDS